MVAPKKIVEVKKNNKGTITHVRLEGNTVFADVSVVINLAKIGKIDAKVVTRKADGVEYLRLGKDVNVFSEDEKTVAEPATTSTPKKATPKKKSTSKKKTKKKTTTLKKPVKKKAAPKKKTLKKSTTQG